MEVSQGKQSGTATFRLYLNNLHQAKEEHKININT